MNTILPVGNGEEYASIGEALHAVSLLDAQSASAEPEPVTIRLQPGTYREKVEIRRSNVCLEGSFAGSTVISWDDCAVQILEDGVKRGTFRSYTLLALGNCITLKHLTIENTAGSGKDVGQAVALFAEGDRIKVEDCRLLGSQDTLFTGPLPPKEVEPGGFRGPTEFLPRVNGRQYYRDCYIAGGVDFIFGSATAYFERCTIFSLNEEPGYATAGSSPEGQAYGYVFESCRFLGAGSPGTRYLGRPWREFAKTVILNSEIGAHIAPEGWDDWGKTAAHQTVFYAEYKNFGPGAEGRRPDWVHALTDEEAAEYTREKVLDGWS